MNIETDARDLVSQSSDLAVDEAVISKLVDLGGEEFMAELIGVYLEDTPPRLAAMTEAMVTGDLEAARGAAHAMKSSCANVGATKLVEICRLLELASKVGKGGEASAFCKLADAEFRQVSTNLEQRVA